VLLKGTGVEFVSLAHMGKPKGNVLNAAAVLMARSSGTVPNVLAAHTENSPGPGVQNANLVRMAKSNEIALNARAARMAGPK